MHIKLIHKKIQLFHFQNEDSHIQNEFPLEPTFADTSHSYAVVRASDLTHHDSPLSQITLFPSHP